MCLRAIPIKGAWAVELSGFSVEQIKHALYEFSERPSNLIQIKDVWRLAQKFFETQQLTYRPKVPQEKRAKLLEAAGL